MSKLLKDQMLEDEMAKDEMGEDDVAWYRKNNTLLYIKKNQVNFNTHFGT